MTTLNDILDTYKTQINGRLRQGKGLVREEWGELTGDDVMRLAGKKDQIKGWLQVKFGNHWLLRHKSWLILLATAVSVTVSALAFLLSNRMRAAEIRA
jgi:uncharacterized protein YjbJ (UPF0337 family)